MPRILLSFPPFLPASQRRGFLADLAENGTDAAAGGTGAGTAAAAVDAGDPQEARTSAGFQFRTRTPGKRPQPS